MVPYFDLRDEYDRDGKPEPPAVENGAGLEADPPGRLEVTVDELTRDILDEFVQETADLLEGCESALLILEAGPGNPEAINTVFRGFHTIKGTAACLDIGIMSRCAHHAESLFSRIREGELRCTGAVADLALRSVDMLRRLNDAVVEAVREGSAPLPPGLAGLLQTLKETEAAPAAGGPKEGRMGAGVAPETPEVLSSSATAEGAAGRPAASPASPATEPAAESSRLQAESIRVRTDRLDRLIDMVGELVLSQSMIAQDARLTALNSPGLNKKVDQANKILRELHDLSLSLRMVPLHAVFRKVTRVVRDLSHRTGKQVEFIPAGEDTEIDRNMVDLIADPLVHMVRNSLDHGLEPAEERERRGKPGCGRLILTASHESGHVVLRLQDDGRGLDRVKIVQKAVEQDLILSDAGMTDVEVYNLIFRPGFSTAETVTDVSGRGVGLDVVRRSIDTLHGRIEIASRPGRGTTFTLRLPLTLAIADGMLIRAGSQRFILPTIHICMTFKPHRGDVSTVQGRGEVVTFRDEILPVFRLSRLFGIEADLDAGREGLLVVIEENNRRYALLVDELIHQQQVVVKSLGPGIGRVYGISGAAILGDGTVGLILEASEIRSLGRRLTSGGASPDVSLPYDSFCTLETDS